jgi:hypothetical protein
VADMLTPEELEAHVKTNIWKMYPGDISEILLGLYQTVQLALRLDTSKLVIGPAQVIHLDEDEQVLFKLHSDDLASEIAKSKVLMSSYMEVFNLILSRDELISEHFELIASTPEQSEYLIKNS